ncbi:lysine N6-hydroxylase [Thalassolituus maritimus]|uniref:Lysine N6-hydroxylase n=1 Tax=Thalassolituus maritimus TaxID=484498 RepID=A0A1N7Q9D6_9GAMM|nr:SidA/IucD/PvdA family monooxygenase [Thalassolituus maritimus]SIT19434.1 lysine N6-hydroxylase [Thalassolituus maritimus]
MIYDLVGIGAGPSNLSLAALSPKHLNAMYIERRPEFSWHKGMEFSFADLQVSFVKDLVTLADPTNEHSFLNYLHTNGKLYHFLNAQFQSVSRKEYADYFKWVSQRLDNILMSECVLSVNFDEDFIVETDKRTLRSKNISVGVGKVQYIPSFARPLLGNNNFHVSQYKYNDHQLAGKKIIIVGGGQSGAEAFYDLISRDKDDAVKQVYWITRRDNFLPIDDSPFTNDLFMPCQVEYLQQFSYSKKKEYVRKNILTSDGISGKTLNDIYQLLYRYQFLEDNPLEFKLMPSRSVEGLTKIGTKWLVNSRHLEYEVDEHFEADVIIWATGFCDGPKNFLRPIDHKLEKVGVGEEYMVDNDYSVVWNGPKDRNIFMLNSVKNQKGLSDPNLSLTAWRSRKVLDRIENKACQQVANKSLVEWNPIQEIEPFVEQGLIREAKASI